MPCSARTPPPPPLAAISRAAAAHPPLSDRPPGRGTATRAAMERVGRGDGGCAATRRPPGPETRGEARRGERAQKEINK